MEAASVKRVWAGILAVGILLGMSGCAANKEGAVKENGKASGMEKVLRVGGEATYPPFYLKTNMDTMSDSKWILLRR